MRGLRLILVCVAALALTIWHAHAHANERQPGPFPFPVPSGLPFIGIGPQPEAVPINSEGWRAVVAAYGQPSSGPQTRLVDDIVAEVSRGAGTVAPKGGYRGTLLNSSVVNAFAIGDGNVFITRQLLAHLNDEDEMIGVMGHEVGHVIGAHSRVSGAAHAGQAGADRLLGVFLPPLRDAGQLGSTVVIRAFGRSQEHAADIAGVKFLADLGRDPHAMERSLSILEAHGKLQEKMFGSKPPSAFDYWLSSHPVHAERMGMVRMAAGMAPRSPARQRRSESEFIRALDGMVFDDSPEQGIIDGARFRHPVMKLGLDAAAGFRLLNSASALLIRGPGGSSATLKPVSVAGSAAERFTLAWRKSFPEQIAPPTPDAVNSGGIPIMAGSVVRRTDEGESHISMWLYAWSENQSLIYVAVDPQGSQASQHAATARSLRRLTNEEAAATKVRRISVVDIRAGDTVKSLAEKMAYSDFREERFRVINGLFAGEELPNSGPIKLVIWSLQ